MVELILHIREIYQDWFKDSPDDPDDRATPAEIEAILAGRAPLPPGAILHFDVGVNPPSTPLSGIPIPLSMVFTVFGPGKSGSDTYTPSDSGPSFGALGKVKPGKFNRSKGYSGLLVTYPPGGDGPSTATLQVRGVVDGADVVSQIVKIPLVAKG